MGLLRKTLSAAVESRAFPLVESRVARADEIATMKRHTKWIGSWMARRRDLTSENERLGYSVDPHADGNERADSRIQVHQPDGSILRSGPSDIHAADHAPHR
jgi:hypothetical protein